MVIEGRLRVRHSSGDGGEVMPHLKVYRDDADFVVAYSADHASEVWSAHVGERHGAPRLATLARGTP
jgi:hypothetical protein